MRLAAAVRRASPRTPRHLSTMRAVVLPEPGPIENLVVMERPVPELKAADDVLVEVSACAVCHRDLLDRAGAFPFINKDVVLGHEIAGTVVDVGPGVRGLAPGDNVVSLHWAPCGACRACLEGRHTHCSRARETFFGLTADGGYATHTVNRESAFVRVCSSTWTPLEAAPVMCTYGTVWHGAITNGGLRPGERVLVTGASGGVGSAALQMLSALGCHVVAVTSNPDKVEHLELMGATEVVVHSPKAAFFKQLDVKVDMALDNVGEPTFEGSLRSLRPGGRVVLIGNVTNSKAAFPLGLAIVNGLSVIGSDSVSAVELADCFAFMGRRGIKPHIHRVLPLEAAPEAQRLLEAKEVQGRVVLEMKSGW